MIKNDNELTAEDLETCDLNYILEQIVPHDKKLLDIFHKFDKTEEIFYEDPSDRSMRDLFENILSRIENGEFSKLQAMSIYARLKKSKELFVQKKQEIITENNCSFDRYKNISKYITNSFLR